MDETSDVRSTLPDAWRSEVQAQLQSGETIAAWFEPDLNQRLCFDRRMLVLTDRRILGFGEPESTEADQLLATTAVGRSATNGSATPAPESKSSPNPPAAQWQGWEFNGDLAVRCTEQTGAGSVEVLSSTRRLAHWRYSLAASAAAHRFVARCQNQATGQKACH